MHPDLFIFAALLIFSVVLFAASDVELKKETGFRTIFFGAVWMTFGTFIDFIEHLPFVARSWPILGSETFDWVIVAGFIAPGAVVTSFGVMLWVPKVARMNAEIGRRRKIEAELRDSEERARVLVDYAPEAITIIDAKTGVYVDANSAAETLHGLDRDHLVGKVSPWELSPKEQPDGRLSSDVAKEKLKLALDGKTPRFDWVHLHSDGDEQLCEVSLVRLPGKHDHHIRASVVDISVKNKTEAALRRSQKMEALAVLSGGAAHDFNNQLAIILGAAEEVDEGTTPNAELKKTIIGAVKKGAGLTRRLLTYARQQSVTEELVNLDNAVCTLADDLRRTIGRSIRIECKSDADLWLAKLDRSQLQDALLNLALNARDAMPEGGTLTFCSKKLTLTPETASMFHGGVPGAFVEIAVSDTGSGIAPHHLNRIFEPFYTTKTHVEGSGLGLASVDGFVGQAGGFVAVDSTVGVGTTFRLFLPRAQNETGSAMTADPILRV